MSGFEWYLVSFATTFAAISVALLVHRSCCESCKAKRAGRSRESTG